MSTPSVDHRKVRYDLLCGHSYTVPAEVEEQDEGGPQSPYGWCGSCSAWQLVTGKVPDEVSSSVPDEIPGESQDEDAADSAREGD
ncbi:hypothetical protein GCM10027258_80140 [Amycolatopsis stemonae]